MPTGSALPIIAAAVPPSSWYQCERHYEEGMGYSRHETTEQYNRSQYSAGSVDNHCQHCLCAVPNRPRCHTIVPVLSFNKRANIRGNDYTVSRKDVPHLTCHNLSMHGSIATIFGTNVAEKVGSQNVPYFPTSPNYCSYTTWETGNPEIASFHLNAACFFTKKHETIKNITCLELNHPSLSKQLIGCTTEDLEREHSILLSVTHMFCINQVCHGDSRCVKDGSCSSSSLE